MAKQILTGVRMVDHGSLDHGSQEPITNPAAPTDEQLFEDWRSGERAALVAIVERHETRLAQIAYRITGCRQEAEDVRHTVFVRFLQWAGGPPQKLNRVGAWLTRCTVNEAVTRMRGRNREGRVIADLAAVARLTVDASPLERLQQDESREQLSRALAQLSPDERALLSLRFDEGLTFREIAEVLERPASTVKSQVAQAIAQLRKLLGPTQ